MSGKKSGSRQPSILDLGLGLIDPDESAKDDHDSDPVFPEKAEIQVNVGKTQANSEDAISSPNIAIHLAQICQRMSSIENNVIFIRNYIEKKIHDEANLVKYEDRGSSSTMKLQNRQIIHSGLLKKN